MRTRIFYLAIASLVLLANISQSGPPLRLHRTTLAVPLSPVLAAAVPGPYAIIRLRGPITPADRQAIEQTGVTLLEYVPDYAYLVRGTPARLDAAVHLPQVQGQAPFTLADKLAPALLRAIARGDGALGQVHIVGWPDDHGALARDVQALAVGGRAADSAEHLLRVAELESVRWIEPASHPKLLNDYARTIMQVDPAWQNHHLFGTGQVIAVADSGLDTGDMPTLSPDFAGRIAATHVLSDGADWGDGNGHGTHVAGSIAGAGVQSGADPAHHLYTDSFAGVAPEARLVIQAFEVLTDGTVIGLDDDYYQLFAQAYYSDGVRLHSNSWGDLTGPITDTETAYGGYPYGSQRTDQFVWEHPDMAIFFAAGNSGTDGTPGAMGFCVGGDGVVDPDSLLFPGTAKNVITVGAGESNRSTGGLGGYPWLLLNLCFTTAPINLDLVANNPDGMAAFSSRGPTDDGRTKPDIIAPGTNIVSNRSHYPGATALWGAHEVNADYAYSGGSSMATPLVAGAGVLVRQWLAQQGLANPSAALIKAILLNTTHAMAPGQYGTGPTQEIPFDRPNNVSGWGRLDLGFIDATAPYTLWFDDHATGLQTGQAISYTHSFSQPLTIVTGTHPLRVMLAWTDPPASLSASSQLVNDLDLVAIGPGDTRYFGNDVPSGDRINNVEGIVVDNPPVGQYRLEVSAHNVPVDSQPYALVVAGPLQDRGQSPVTVSRTHILTGTWHTFTGTCARVWFTDTGRPPVTAVTVTLSYDYPSIDGHGLPRRYDIEADGSGFQAMLSLCYTDKELIDAGIDPTQEANLHAYRYDLSSTDWITYSLVNTITNQVTATLVTEFGVWGLGVASNRPTVVTLQTHRMQPENLLTLLLIGPGVSLGWWMLTRRQKRR
jgi:hypothetical protein